MDQLFIKKILRFLDNFQIFY